MPSDAQICAFSATYSQSFLDKTKNFMHDPHLILLLDQELNLNIISQFKIVLDNEKYKMDTLLDIYSQLIVNQVVIFANSIKRGEHVYKVLKSKNYEVSFIHGKMEDYERIETLKNFRRQKYRILVTTDILSRGIDIHHITMVFNYDIPSIPETYLHRIGRSGRFGKKGVALNFVVDTYRNSYRSRDVENMSNIEQKYNIQIEEMPEPEYINQMLYT